MSDALIGLRPQTLWGLFAQIVGIPHGSKHETLLATHLRQVAGDAGFTVVQDEAGNMGITVPATKGYEHSPTVVLQGHLDMVCEKNEDVEFDFARDAIRVVRGGDWIKAQGTTLGADNGIGVAAAFAVALSDDFVHGPLEILLTVDEETGLNGATRLSPSLVTGRILLNLDSEKAHTVCIGCAGGGGVTTQLPLDWTEVPQGAVGVQLKLTGLRGGHSGLDIHENRANAIKLMSRSLSALKGLEIALADFRGGDKHNAIPREAIAVVALPIGNVSQLHSMVSDLHKSFQVEFPHEREMQSIVTPATLPPQVVGKKSFETLVTMLLAFSNGVLAMSQEMPGLVETSTNLATAHLKDGVFTVHNSSRSSVPQALKATMDQVVAVAQLAGATHRVVEPYPGWRPNTDSKLLHIVENVYQELFGRRPTREATHAGLECGVIGKKLGTMDMISIGPDIVNAHSPQEAVSVISVEKFWRLLTAVLARIAQGSTTEA